CRFPEEFVYAPGTAVAHQEPITTEMELPLFGQVAHPGPVFGARVREGVVVTDAGEVVIARVRIAALAVGQLLPDGVVVIALNALHVVPAQQRKDTIRVRAKRTEVAQTIHGVYPAPPHVAQGRFEGQVVVVNAAKDGDAFEIRHRVVRRWGWH